MEISTPAEVHQQIKEKLDQTPEFKLKSCRYLSGVMRNFSGELIEAKPYQYQIEAILLMQMIKRFVLGDDTGTGKTLEFIFATAYLLERNPDMKVLYCGPLSTLAEKMDEWTVMTKGLKIAPIFGLTAKKRAKVLEDFQRRGNLLITTPGLIRKDYKQILPALGDNYMCIWDEASYFKSSKSQIHKIAKYLSDRAERVISVTATVIKNNLHEAWAIWRVTNDSLLGSKRSFDGIYAVFEEVWRPYRRGRGVPIKTKNNRLMMKVKELVCYRNISLFKQTIRGHFIGRTVEQIGKQLPEIIFKEINLKMQGVQARSYVKCLLGILESQLDKSDNKLNPMTLLMESLRISLALQVIPEYADVEELSSKEQEIIRLLNEDLVGEKVIIYASSVRWVKRFIPILKKQCLKENKEEGRKEQKVVTIIGEDSQEARHNAKNQFNQDPDTRVCIISDAGGEGINLTAARVMIFATLPWSYGQLKQLLGRFRRLGSTHHGLLALFLINDKTNDRHVMDTLKRKKQLFESVFDDSVDTLDSDRRVLKDLYNHVLEAPELKDVVDSVEVQELDDDELLDL